MPVEDIAYSVFEQLAQQLPEQLVVGVNTRQIQEQILERCWINLASILGSNIHPKPIEC